MAERITELRYRIEADKSVDYDKALPINDETEDFKICIDKGFAIFKLKRPFSKIEEARTVIEDYLKRWDVLIGIEYNPDELRFTFENAFLSSENNHTHLIMGDEIKISDEVIVHRSYTRYPILPINFSLSPDVETMYLRYKAYRQSREPLTSMAYMCLTILQASAGGREKASRKYRISTEVLKHLGLLCSTKGDKSEARKAAGSFNPLTGDEKAWIEAVIKSVIKRVGEWACNPDTDFKELTLADFPDLSHA
ncbi:MAG: hypothetical protein HY956_07130 [Deltaproteobacteria bacterium]|nr:hypothetical protein [Deltaproteobacteria bacterium]